MDKQLNHEKKSLIGSRDEVTGQLYFPPRPLAADGSLRATVLVELSREGILYSWTKLGDRHYGQIDLPEGVRIQCLLAPSEHTIDSKYILEITGDEDDNWRFRHA